MEICIILYGGMQLAVPQVRQYEEPVENVTQSAILGITRAPDGLPYLEVNENLNNDKDGEIPINEDIAPDTFLQDYRTMCEADPNFLPLHERPKTKFHTVFNAIKDSNMYATRRGRRVQRLSLVSSDPISGNLSTPPSACPCVSTDLGEWNLRVETSFLR